MFNFQIIVKSVLLPFFPSRIIFEYSNNREVIVDLIVRQATEESYLYLLNFIF